MTEFWLVRHGQTDWNLQGRYQGQADPPLNETGVQQAQAAAEALAGRCYAALYSSDLERARVTAEIIARRLGLEVIVDPRLREVNQGAWEGLLVTEIQERYPLEWEARQRDRLRFRAPGGGESVEDVAARIWAAMDDIARRHPCEAVIVVSHGLALATMLCRGQNIPLAQARELIPDNAEIVRLEWNPPFAQ
ncbi:MAG: histidine phosphatase family protein [Caldilinea sp.]|uniref:histidine phosphatase family protein n=1 Tax=Caldilinea sp. TaxID=2293560 RepID=UPI0030A4C685